MKILALDVGEKRIGVAATDESGIFAKPIGFIPVEKDLIKKIATYIESESPEKIIFGIPRHQNGEESVFAKQIKDFAKGIHHEFNLEIDFEDESGTTKIAEENLRQKGKSEKEIKSLVDAEAACIILESYLKRI